MEAQLWTINGLSVQLDIDRRTLARQLEGLRPAATEKRNGGSVVRKYRLNDVLEYMNRPKGTPRDPTAEELAETASTIYGFVGSQVWPGMIHNAFPIITGALTAELGLSEVQAVEAIRLVAVGLAFGLVDAAGEHPLKLQQPDVLLELRELGAAAFVAKHWPD
jgi:hypothetical protein